MKTKQEAIAEHTSLSKLFIENTNAFNLITTKMIEKAINNSTNPDKQRNFQEHISKQFKTDEEMKLILSISELKKKFKKEGK